MQKITSLQNPKVKTLVKLRERKTRDQLGVFLLEGYRAISRALEQNVQLPEVYFCPEEFLGKNDMALLRQAEAAGSELIELSKPAFDKIAYRDRPEGLLAIAKQWRTTLDDIVLPENPFLLVAEAIEKPGNLGTMLRSADAAGVDAVIVCDYVTDLFNPNVVRSSTGVLFAVPVVFATTDQTIEWLAKKGITTVATTPNTDKYYTETDMTGPTAIVMGSEQFGLSDTWLSASNKLVRIPMAGQADSLNVAMATIITLFEAVRQRGTGK